LSIQEETMSQTTTTTVGVQARLDGLQEERNRTWSVEQLETQTALRDELEATVDRERLVKPGDRVPDFRLPEADGGNVALAELLAVGPVVLIFFRFEGCGACNAALPGYQEALAPALRDLGAQLVAISPQVPEKLAEIKHRYGFDFPVASDTDAALIEALGIGFEPDVDARARTLAAGNDLGAILGTGSWTLPYPTVIVLDRDGVVRFADVHPDWMVRTEADAIIEAVQAL
jgi:peroxiredoxin